MSLMHSGVHLCEHSHLRTSLAWPSKVITIRSFLDTENKSSNLNNKVSRSGTPYDIVCQGLKAQPVAH